MSDIKDIKTSNNVIRAKAEILKQVTEIFDEFGLRVFNINLTMNSFLNKNHKESVSSDDFYVKGNFSFSFDNMNENTIDENEEEIFDENYDEDFSLEEEL